MSCDEFQFGSLMRPGHRGVWEEALRTGKYPINPYCYKAEIVPTAILTLNWADRVSAAHNLDAKLEQIVAKSSEGFIFKIVVLPQDTFILNLTIYENILVGRADATHAEVTEAARGAGIYEWVNSLPGGFDTKDGWSL